MSTPQKKYGNLSVRLKTPAEALDSLRRQCARSEKCISDIRRTLYRWNISPEEHDKIIGSLLSDRFIDEQRYASAFVRDKVRFSKWGIRKISAALRAKGIPQDIIDQAISEIVSSDMQDKLLENIRRKSSHTQAKNRYDLRNKLIRYGLSQGYDLTEVLDAVNTVTGTSDDSDEF